MATGIEFLPPQGEYKKLDDVVVWQSPGRIYVALCGNLNCQRSVLLRQLPNDAKVEEVVMEMGRKIRQSAVEDIAPKNHR